MRADLLAIHPRDRGQVVGEFKRLYNGAQAASMVSDIPRIREFELNTTYRHPGSPRNHQDQLADEGPPSAPGSAVPAEAHLATSLVFFRWAPRERNRSWPSFPRAASLVAAFVV